MRYFALIAVTFFYLSSTAQVDQKDSIYLNNVEKQGSIMAKLLLEKDYKAFTKFTYPGVIKIIGGEVKMVALLKQTMNKWEVDGYSILNCTIERPLKIIHFKNELQCTVPQEIEMTTPDGRLITKSTLIGISADKGENWTFIETQGKELKKLQTNFPNLSPDLVIPPKEKPVIYND